MRVRNNKGIAIAATLFVMALLAVVTVTVITLSLSQTNQSVWQERRIQAYYLGRSGAESVAQYILRHPSEAGNFLAAGRSEPNSSFGNGTFEVEVLPGASTGQIIVKGIGVVNQVQNAASIVLMKPSDSLLLDKAIYSARSLDITGMVVRGNIQSGGTINYRESGANAFHGDALMNSPRIIEVNWPATPGNASPFNLNVTNQQVNINASGNFGNIVVSNNGILNINAGTGIIRIFVDNLFIDNRLNIVASGGGRVEIYVRQKMEVRTRGEINNLHPERLFVFLADGIVFEIQANMVYNGYIIGPNSTVEVQSAQSTINGAIFADFLRKNVVGQGPNGEVNFVQLPAEFTLGDVLHEYRVVQ